MSIAPSRPTISPPRDDQATRLRQLVEASRQSPQKSPASRTAPEPKRQLARVVAIASGKGGVGKTNISVNLSIALARLGLQVTLVDADLGLANADLLCGMAPRQRLDRLSGGAAASLDDLAIPAPGGFRLVPGSLGPAQWRSLSVPLRTRVVDALETIESRSDLILVDIAAGIGADVLSFIATADLAIVVTTPEPTAIADAYALTKCAVTRLALERDKDPEAGGGHTPLMLVVNQAQSASEASAVHRKLERVAREFLGSPLPLLGKVSADSRVPAAVRARSPFVLHSPRTRASRDVESLVLPLVRAIGMQHRAKSAASSRSFVQRLVGMQGLDASARLGGAPK